MKPTTERYARRLKAARKRGDPEELQRAAQHLARAIKQGERPPIGMPPAQARAIAQDARARP